MLISTYKCFKRSQAVPGPGVGPGGDNDVLHILHPRDIVEVLHTEGGDLILGHAWLHELGELVVEAVTDSTDDAHALLLSLVLLFGQLLILILRLIVIVFLIFIFIVILILVLILILTLIFR